MTFLSAALSAGNLTKLRSNYQVMQCVALVPNAVVYQFQPSAAPDGNVYAEITIGSVVTGAYSDALVGQTVIFSTSSDHTATEVWRGRVRKAATATTFYVNETSQDLDATYYVTVIDNYGVFEKLRVVRSGVEYADWDIVYRAPLPIITALPTAVVLVRGTVGYSFAPTAQAMASGATISTWLWDVDDGTITVGTSASQNITATFPVGFRHVRLTVTDSNGNSNFRVILVWVVPADFSSVVTLGFGDDVGSLASINYTPGRGYNATIPAKSSLPQINPHTMACIFTVEWHDNTYGVINTNIQFVGYFRRGTINMTGDRVHGLLTRKDYELEGFGELASRLPISTLKIVNTASPAVWGDIASLTQGRAVTYTLTEHTTLLHLCSLALPSDDTSFVGDDLGIEEGIALEAVTDLASVLNANLDFAPSGEIQIKRDAIYLSSSDRNALATVVTFEPGDILQLDYDDDYAETVGQVEMVGGVYDTTADTYTIYKAVAPASARGRGSDRAQNTRQVLTTDTDATAARAEIAQRAANFLAASNPTDMIRATLKGQWWFLIPQSNVWYKFNLTVDGVDISAVRWQLVGIDTTANVQEGRIDCNAEFRRETSDTGARIAVTELDVNDETLFDDLPPILPPWTGGDGDIGSGDIWDVLDPPPPGTPETPASGCGVYAARMKTGTQVATSFNAAYGEAYSINAVGSGIIDSVNLFLESFEVVGSESAYTLGTVNTEIGKSYKVVVTGTILEQTGSTAYDNWFPANGDYDPLGTVSGDDMEFDYLTAQPFITLTLATARRVSSYIFWYFNTSGDQSWKQVEIGIGSYVETVNLNAGILSTASVTVTPPNKEIVSTITHRKVTGGTGDDDFFLVKGTSPYNRVTYNDAETDHDPQYNSTDLWATHSSSNNVQFDDGTRPAADDTTYNDEHTYAFTRSGDGNPIGLRFYDAGAYGDNEFSWTVTVYEVSGGITYGDSFYQWTDTTAAAAYAPGLGLKVNSFVPSAPPYNGAHSYDFTKYGSGVPIVFQYADSDYSDNENADIIATVCGSGAK